MTESTAIVTKTVTPTVIYSEPDNGLPKSERSEKGVLGSILRAPDEVFAECATLISADYFYHPAHRVIYKVLLDLWDNSKPIDLITVTEKLSNLNVLEKIGGAYFIKELYTFVPTSKYIKSYIVSLREAYLKRSFIDLMTDTIRKAHDPNMTAEVLSDGAETALMQLRLVGKPKISQGIKELLFESINTIEDIYNKKGGIQGLETGFKKLDRMINGLQNGEMIVIAARPSVGKSALASNIIENVAIKNKKWVAFFSLEMSARLVTQRLICSQLGISIQRVRDGFASKKDMERFHDLKIAVSQDRIKWPICLDDSSEITISELRARARRYKHTHGIELIIIDYLTLLRPGKSLKNKENEVAEISIGIKALAKEMNIPVVVLAQLNRNVEGREGGKPRLSDLRDSGAIEQDADVVAMIHRPAAYMKEGEERDKAEREGRADLLVLKSRNTAIGEIPLRFNSSLARFENI